jgi:hypothetical protein
LQKLEVEHHIRYRRMIGEEVSAHACIRSIHCQHALGFEDLANATRMCTKTSDSDVVVMKSTEERM